MYTANEQNDKDRMYIAISPGPRNVVLFLACSQDSATVLTECPNREDVPVLGVTDHAVLVEDSHDLLSSDAHTKSTAGQFTFPYIKDLLIFQWIFSCNI
jgi:hypothetical protein